MAFRRFDSAGGHSPSRGEVNMNRRKYIATLGVLGSGTAAAMGTGAFTSASASRDVSVSVADDTNGYLGFSASSGENGEFASVDTSSGGDGEIALDFGASDGGGSGVGLNSTYNFDDVFTIENQGTQTIYVWANFSGEDLDDDDIWFYPGSDSGRKLNDGSNSVVTLTTGQQVNVGVHIDTSALSSTDEQALTATLNADVDVPGGEDGSQPSDPVGEDAAVVSKDPDVGEFDSIQEAIDSVDGTTVLVESGRYEESVTIDVDGLTLEGADGAEPIINGSGAENAVEAGADDVTVRGFQVEGFAQRGIYDGENDGMLIENNVATDPDPGEATIQPIQIEGDDAQVIDNTVESVSEFEGEDYNSVGILAESTDNAEIRNNTVEVTDGGIGISTFYGNATGNTIAGNNVTSEVSYGISVQLTAEGNSASDTKIIDNTVDDSSTGLSLLDFGGAGITGTVVSNNEFEDNDVHVSDPDNFVDLDAILNEEGNTFDPDAEVDEDEIVPVPV